VTVCAAAILVAGAAWSLSGRGSVPPAAKFRTERLDRGSVTQVVLATGLLQPVETVNVGTQVSGTVIERLVDFNDRVTKGQVLLRLDPASSKARVRQATAQLEANSASLVLAAAVHERNERLLAKGFVSELALEQSKRELAAAKANMELAKAQLDAAQTDLDYNVIRSPIDGVILRRNIDVGQTVAASFQTPELFQVAGDLGRMRMEVSVSEADIGRVENGQEVRFTVDAYPDRDFQGRVSKIRLNSTNSQGVVTYPVVVDLANPDWALKPGMTAQSQIIVSRKRDVLRIPTAALRFKPAEAEEVAPAGGDDAVGGAATGDSDDIPRSVNPHARIYRAYTIDQHQVAHGHELTIGVSNTRFTEVTSGDLKPGDRVATGIAEVAGEAAK